jgi:hypothetical protein
LHWCSSTKKPTTTTTIITTNLKLTKVIMYLYQGTDWYIIMYKLFFIYTHNQDLKKKKKY